MITKALVKLIALTLAVLLAYTAVSKLEQYALFTRQLQQFPFSVPVLHQQAWVVAAVELIIAAMLLLPVTRLKGLFASLFLMSLYTLYLTGMLDSRFYCTCHCGEPFQSLSLKMHIGVNLLCVLFTGVGVVLSGRIVEPSLRELKKSRFVQPYYKQMDTTLINSEN